MSPARERHPYTAYRRRGRWVLPVVAVMLTLPLIGVLMVTTDLRGHGDQAARDTMAYVAQVSEHRVASFVESAEDAVYDATLAFDGTSVGRDVFELPAQLQPILARDQLVRAMIVAFPDGSMALVRHDEDGYVTRSIQATPERSELTTTRDESFSLLTADREVSEVDMRDRDWYVAAEAADGAVWTEPVIRLVTRTVGVWITTAVRDEEGNVVAVFAADMRIDALASELNDLPPGTQAEAFLLGPDRTVIAAPATYSDAIEQHIAEYEAPIPAAALGIDPGAMVAPRASEDAFDAGSDGTVLLERGLASGVGVDWVIHLSASKVGLSPALADLDNSLVVITVVMIVVMALVSVLVLRFWRPVADARWRSMSDPLTGLANRARFEREAPRALADAHRRGGRLALAMMDLDNFKRLNDTLGHDAGDRALNTVAELLHHETRGSDLVVRWGGDEFLIAFTCPVGTDPHAIIERLRKEVCDALLMAEIQGVKVGATVGVTVSQTADDAVGDLVARADAALVEGKKLAKGKTYLASALLPSSS